VAGLEDLHWSRGTTALVWRGLGVVAIWSSPQDCVNSFCSAFFFFLKGLLLCLCGLARVAASMSMQ